MKKIILYDFNELSYSSYVVEGFFKHAKKNNYNFKISNKYPGFVKNLNTGINWKKLLHGTLVLKFVNEKTSYYFCIDVRDGNNSSEYRGHGFHLPLLQSNEIKYYFKTNYNFEEIKNDNNLKNFAYKIIPSLPFFGVKPSRILPLVPMANLLKSFHWNKKLFVQRLKDLKNFISIGQIQNIREQSIIKNIDVFYVMTYYNKDRHKEDNDFRYELIQELRNNKNINAVTGLVSNIKIPGKYAELQIPGYTYNDYLVQQSQSKIAIYTRGVHNCISFKLGQLMALQLPIIGQKIINNTDYYYSIPYFKEQFNYESPKEIVQKIEELLKMPDYLENIACSNFQYFNQNLLPINFIDNMMDKLTEV